jgi:hypothetical protein
MILLIPYTRFTLKTYQTVDEAECRLREHIELRKLSHVWQPYNLKYFTGLRSWWHSHEHKYFIGNLTDGNFSINRIIHYRNSFLPVIIGQIHSDLGMSRIEITMRLSYFVGIILTAFWLFILSGFLFSPQTGIDKSGAITFLGFFIFFYGVVMGFFNYEVNKARRYLEKIFEVNDSI